MTKNVKLVIFDMDGLMFDTEMMYLKFAPKAAKKLGYDISEDILKKTIGTNHQWAFEILKSEGFRDFPFKEFWDILDEAYSNYFDAEGVPIKQGLIKFLEHLKKNNVKMAVATSSRREKAERLLTEAKVRDYFSLITCGDEIVNAKPDPEIFLKTADKLKVKYEECLVLEDSLNGIRAAKNANMIPVMIPDMIEPTEEIIKLIYKKYNNLEEVIQIF